ncbi:MAG: cytochrome P450 [Halothece sp.]
MTSPEALRTPALVQTLQLVANPIRFFQSCQREYGDRFSTRVLGFNSPPVIFLGNPNDIKAVFTAPPGQFALGKITHVFRPFTGDRSLIMLDGEEHQRARKLLMPPFHGDRMKLYGDIICSITQSVIEQFPQQKPFAIRPFLSDITLQVILAVVFGVKPGKRYEELKSRINDLLETITNPFYSSLFFFPPLQLDFGSWSPWGYFVRQQEAIDRLIYEEISDRRQEDYTKSNDILSLLMSARDESGEAMTDVELRDQLITLLFLGHETTASSLAWALYWIYSSPNVLDKLTFELNALEDKTDPNAIANLPYLNAVCSETLRLYPIALISQPRVVQNTVKLEKHSYEPETILVPCIYLAHHREETFPNSLEFKPERFLERKFTPYEYFPFGGGTRACIGGAFSMYEMKLILGTILSHCNLKLAKQAPIKPIRRGITIVPSGGVKMIEN